MSEFRETVCTDEHHSLSIRQAYKALDFARRDIKGDLEDNFNKIWSYCLEIEKTNPKTTFKVEESDLQYEGGKKRFLRMYMCWEACKDGFKYCMPLIGVDGCHIKDKAGGMMLTPVGIDGNEGLFPIAYAIVEGENKDSWYWFLKLLCTDLEIDNVSQRQYTFMSDKQKGLIPAFEEVIPMVSHRFCVRHLHSNMKVAGFGGVPIRDALWKAARATTVSTFSKAMRELKALDVQAFQWLMQKHPAEWSRSHFSTNANSDMLVNNICESFNAMILDARDSPLIHCLEIVRKQVMLRLFECRKQATKWTGRICPAIANKISIFEKQAGGYWAYQSTEVLFQVKGATDQHQVDIGAKTCSCRKWDLNGIPCRHAICALWVKFGKAPLHDYVADCYTIETYKKAYSGCIHPMAGPQEWPHTDREPPLPPLFNTKVGRPRKLRKKSAGEITKDGIHISRRTVTLHCSTCKLIGHNTRKCPQRRNRPPAPPVDVAAVAVDDAPPVDVPPAAEEDAPLVDVPPAAEEDAPLVGVAAATANGDFAMNFQQMLFHEQIHFADTQGHNIQTIVDDVNSQMTGIQSEEMTITSHGVKIGFGQPPKRRKIIAHSTKGKQVVQSAPPSNQGLLRKKPN
ncbi:PREDICTED: uncharacterized protein LOC109188688 isoform X2 [Ipomoea nil]|uniref:uncharacterized protein LOC109188688 isoform X2 n=1 Tax=Ipomoea nil TaxID=35883 RepID=UPI000901DEC1|nr:PREDICTED: uncharacterized protein LOC109188688 isoform X2 [Ipomoea nil]